MACTASNIASFVFIGNLIKEMKANPDNLDYAVPCKYLAFVMTAFLIILQACFQVTIKAEHCFWDSEPKQLTQTIQNGPAKGIKQHRITHKPMSRFMPISVNIKILKKETYCSLRKKHGLILRRRISLTERFLRMLRVKIRTVLQDFAHIIR